jgi:hypothetical protein
MAGGKLVSNILWSYGHETIPRHLRDIVVTEYGVADLRGKSDRDVIAAMLSVADARFQPGLLKQAKDAGKIESTFEIPEAHRNNTPARIAAALAGAHARGLLPAFPFGTDFTDVEQRLLPVLQSLKSAPPWRLFLSALRGFLAAAPTDEDVACLARLGLENPGTILQKVYRALVRDALAMSRKAG